MDPSLADLDSPAWRCCGRVAADGIDLGAGVAVGPRLVLTARHVAERGRAGTLLGFETASGTVEVLSPIRFGDRMDAAALDLAGDVDWLRAADARSRGRWYAKPTGISNDPVLDGIVTATSVQLVDQYGNLVTVMQLRVDQDLGDFGGYSGSAVLDENGHVTGLLIEQKPQRLRGLRPPAANVLYALPIREVVTSVRAGATWAPPAPVPEHGRGSTGETGRLSAPLTFNIGNIGAETSIVVSSAGDLTPVIQSQPPPEPPAEAMPPRTPAEPLLPALALPAGLGPVVGRRKEIRDVTRTVQRGDRRLITLWGPPGVGKSRLSLEIAAQSAAAFPDRVGYLRLEAVPAGAAARPVAQFMMDALGMPEGGPRDVVDALRTALGQRPAMLVLDNCEHVIAAVAEIAERLLGAAGGLRVLTTSQKPLGVDGEYVYEVLPLGLGDAVRLFTSLAREGRPRAPELPEAIVRDICEKVNMIPLAIRLAAARVRDGDAITEVRGGLGRILRVLVDSGQYSNPRHRAMETALDWSYEFLDEDGRRTLRVASVFAAPFDRLAAGYLLGESETGLGSRTAVALRTLTRCALLQAAESRYSWLEAIRQYGEKKLQQSGEAASVNERFVRYFVELAETAAQDAHGAGELHWLARLGANRDHLRAALAILAQRPQDAELRLRLAAALDNFWRRSGYLEWGSDELRHALASSQAQGRPRARALEAAGRIAERRGDLADAGRLLAEALALARTLQDDGLEAQALQAKGFVMHEAGQSEAARGVLDEALRKASARGLRWVQCAALNNLGNVAIGLGRLDKAEEYFSRSRAIARELGDVTAEGTALSGLGGMRLNNGDYPGARSALEASLQIFTDARDVYAAALIRLNLARAALAEKRYDDADAHLRESSAEAQRIGARGLVAWSHDLAGELEETRAWDPVPDLPAADWRAGLTSAIGQYEMARDLHREAGDPWRAAASAEAAGSIAADLSDLEAARRYLGEAAWLQRQAGREDEARRVDSVIAETEARLAWPQASEGLLRLEALLAADDEGPEAGQVRDAIRATEVYALGHPVDEEASSDLLHFTVDGPGGPDLVMLPVFTRPDAMREALLRNPEWQALSVLEVNGGALLDNIEPDVTVVVNPWTPEEFML